LKKNNPRRSPTYGDPDKKYCPACAAVKPRTPEYWYMQQRGDRRLPYFKCKLCCRKEPKTVVIVAGPVGLKKVRKPILSIEDAAARFHGDGISSADLYLVLRQTLSPDAALQRLNEERKIYGLPPLFEMEAVLG
jgi:hypothetical protein